MQQYLPKSNSKFNFDQELKMIKQALINNKKWWSKEKIVIDSLINQRKRVYDDFDNRWSNEDDDVCERESKMILLLRVY